MTSWSSPSCGGVAATLSAARRWPSGVASLDAALAGGVALGRLHEVYAPDAEDVAGAAGFAALLAAGVLAATEAERGGPLVWLHDRRSPAAAGHVQGGGLVELGLMRPALFVAAGDGRALLQAALDAVRCSGCGAVIVQAQGTLRDLDLTASRRLALAAQQSGVTLLLLRVGTEPVASAAETRWAAASAPSRALAAQAPGVPAFAVSLLRQRSGPSGLSWQLEWDRDRAMFRDAALSGAVVSVPVRRAVADAGTGSRRADTRHAA